MLLVTQRQFVGQAPASLAARIEVQLQLVAQRIATFQYAAVLLGVVRAEACRENVLGRVPQQRVLALHAAALRQGLVHQHIARLRVLDEEHHAGHGVQQGRHLLDAGEQGGEVVGGGQVFELHGVSR
ncbi:hypothetical protein D3C85_1246300 [compost metagenome]